MKCAHCARPLSKTSGEINRATKIGAPLYCDRRCSGLARRSGKTKAQRVNEKRIYDAAYRVKNLGRIQANKRAYFERTYDPRKAAVVRKKRMHLHVAYCRQPLYKRWKRDYDILHRAKSFGPFWEVSLLLQQLKQEVSSRASRYEIYRANGTLNKAQTRRRNYETQNQTVLVRR